MQTAHCSVFTYFMTSAFYDIGLLEIIPKNLHTRKCVSNALNVNNVIDCGRIVVAITNVALMEI